VSVWDDLVGQDRVVATLQRAAQAAGRVVSGAAAPAEASEMTHAWLFTGPPGSGRSTAARAFAAALQCPDAGCGHCAACHTALEGSHADVEVVAPVGANYLLEGTRELVRRAAMAPSGGRWHVVIVEDVDRMRGPDLRWRPANALLKALEEPTPRTVWLLCAPSTSDEDVLPTIRSRCRHVGLRTPPTDAVAQVLTRRDGIDPAMAAFVARAAQGHIGRARWLATDESARLRRREVLQIPTSLATLNDCLTHAANLVDAATEDAKATTADVDARETESLSRALGAGTIGRSMPTGSAGQLKDLEKRQKRRATRTQRDALDRALVDLASFYRDVLTVQLHAGVELINDEVRAAVLKVAGASSPEHTLRRLDAVMECRQAIDANVAPLLALEAMTIALRAG
jgi:DNA polymerase-3 subunit delta'